MPEQAAASSDSAATTAIRALRARRTRLSCHLRGKGCPPSPRVIYGVRKLIESKAWAKARRILASRVFCATWGPSQRSTENDRVRRYTVGRPRLRGAAPARRALRWSRPRSGTCATSRCGRWRFWPRADLVACEDTRVTRKLFDHYGLSAPLIAYHDHNAEAVRPKILERLAAGEAVALVSDAGTPLISDPGYRLVRAATAAGHAVSAAPGASSALMALTVAGLPTDRFFFEGFLPAKETRTARADRRACAHPRHPGAVRERAAPCRDARRSRGGARARAKPRSRASSPSCTRKCGAAISPRSPPTTRRGAETRGEIVIVIAPPAVRAGRARPTSMRCCERARAHVGEGGGGRSRSRDRRAAPRRLQPRARACEGQGHMTRPTGRKPPTIAPAAPRPERQVAFRFGLSAESRAAAFLIAKGYRIVARRWRARSARSTSWRAGAARWSSSR